MTALTGSHSSIFATIFAILICVAKLLVIPKTAMSLPKFLKTCDTLNSNSEIDFMSVDRYLNFETNE